MEPTLVKANYTTLLLDVNEVTENFLENLFSDFESSADVPVSLYLEFKSMYNFYEICDKDESIFRQCVEDVYYEHQNYYKELFDNYSKEYNYMTGNTRTMTRNDTSSGSHSRDNTDSGNTDRTEYDLPNKVVTPTTATGYATSKNTENGSSTGHEEGERESEYHSTITHTYSNEILDLKRKYIEQIRNVYREFASKFSDCFLHLFS